MSLENSRTIDAVSTEIATGFTVLTIIDHWDWHDEHSHLLALQEKLNSYFEFVESKQLFNERPEAHIGRVRINVISRLPMTAAANSLIAKASVLARELEIEITTETYPGSDTLQ
jgi:hypothetical protein